jgi:ribonuclease Z
MAEVVFLGTARALPTLSQENTYMALVGQHHILLVDCAGSPYRRLLEAGLDPKRLDTVILTHAHPDHVYGMPALCMGLWLAGRQMPLAVYGPEDTCRLVRETLLQYHPEQWPGMFEVTYQGIPLEPGSEVCTTPDFVITAAPVEHILPAIGLRVVDRQSGRVLAYSGDTEPGPGVHFLARQAHLLIHEATGVWSGHSSPAQAGAVAEAAGVERLVLVHYDAIETPPDAIEQEAHSTYHGPAYAARDLDRLTW